MGKKNPIQHIEWRTRDAAKLTSFYGGLFSWKFEEVMPGQYTMVQFGNKDSAGGIFHLPKEGPPIPTGVSPYITVEELAPLEEKLVALGGKILMSKQEVPEMGHFTMFQDVDGNVMALWQPMAKSERKAAKKAAKKEKKAAKKAKKAEKKSKKPKA